MNLPSVLHIRFLHWQHLGALHTGNFNSMQSNLIGVLLISHSHFCKQNIAWPQKVISVFTYILSIILL